MENGFYDFCHLFTVTNSISFCVINRLSFSQLTTGYVARVILFEISSHRKLLYSSNSPLVFRLLNSTKFKLLAMSENEQLSFFSSPPKSIWQIPSKSCALITIANSFFAIFETDSGGSHSPFTYLLYCRDVNTLYYLDV